VLAQIRGEDISEVPEQYREVIRWTAQQLYPGDERLLAEWPSTWRAQVDELGDVRFCHATPRNDTEGFTRLTPDDRLLPVFAGADASLVVCGHTHRQFDRTIGRVRVVNAGSAGMPFAEPRGAYWSLLGPNVELRRTDYDFTDAAAQIRRTNYPQLEDLSVRYILQPPLESESLELLAQVELR
jgi:hypothetical protein